MSGMRCGPCDTWVKEPRTVNHCATKDCPVMAAREKALRPCPFCGGQGVLDSGPYDQARPTEERCYFVRCRSCAAEGPWFKWPGTALKMWDARTEGIMTDQQLRELDRMVRAEGWTVVVKFGDEGAFGEITMTFEGAMALADRIRAVVEGAQVQLVPGEAGPARQAEALRAALLKLSTRLARDGHLCWCDEAWCLGQIRAQSWKHCEACKAARAALTLP